MRIKNTGIWCKETSKKSQYASKTTIIHVNCIIILSIYLFILVMVTNNMANVSGSAFTSDGLLSIYTYNYGDN
jgi:hypothetical protein